jgi:hypothetical protein
MSITVTDNQYLYENLNYNNNKQFDRFGNRLDKSIYFEPTLFYIETSTGKIFLKLNCEGVIAYNQSCSTYVQNACSYVTCNMITNNRKLFDFLNNFLWRKVYVKMTTNGLFLFVEFEDPYYRDPEYKLYTSLKYKKT